MTGLNFSEALEKDQRKKKNEHFCKIILRGKPLFFMILIITIHILNGSQNPKT